MAFNRLKPTGYVTLDSTGFIMPDSCNVLIQFRFDILVLLYLFCLPKVSHPYVLLNTVIPRLTSDHANEFFG
jgi:hypothetical protein